MLWRRGGWVGRLDLRPIGGLPVADSLIIFMPWTSRKQTVNSPRTTTKRSRPAPHDLKRSASEPWHDSKRRVAAKFCDSELLFDCANFTIHPVRVSCTVVCNPPASTTQLPIHWTAMIYRCRHRTFLFFRAVSPKPVPSGGPYTSACILAF